MESQALAARVDEFRAHAERLLADRPHLRSVMAVVAQYYNDHAEDAVHVRVIASPRDVPVWPHACPTDSWEDDLARDPGECCCMCDSDLDLSRGDSWYWNAFEPYCHEHGGQGVSLAESYLPVAIVRRDGLAWIGCMQRPSTAMLDAASEVLDERTRELLALVHANPDEDGPRAVLGDHWLERGDPRGEAVLHGRAPTAVELRRWLGAIGKVIPQDCATFERGFLVRADVYAQDDDIATVRDHAAWGTVRAVRYLPDSRDVTCAAMVNVRDLGPIGIAGVEALASAARPWRIERLHVVTTEAVAAVTEIVADHLPDLRELVLEVPFDDALLAVLRAAPWRAPLARLVVARTTRYVWNDALPHAFTTWPAPGAELRRELGVPWLAACDALEETAGPAGLEVAFGRDDAVELRIVGWHPYAYREDLVAVIDSPAASSIRLVSTACRAFTDVDLAWLALHCDPERFARVTLG